MLCLYVLHLCPLPKRPEEGVRSLELESRWLEAAIRGYWQSNLGLWDMLGIKPWSSVRASCALHCEPSLQPQRSDLRLEGSEAVEWTNSGWHSKLLSQWLNRRPWWQLWRWESGEEKEKLPVIQAVTMDQRANAFYCTIGENKKDPWEF